MPIDYFLIDPPVPFYGKHFRAPMILPDSDGVNHLVISVGEKYYPTVPDYVEEAAKMGISRRIPLQFDTSALSEKSNLFIIHQKAINTATYNIPIPYKSCFKNHDGINCIYDLWPLSTLYKSSKKHEVIELDEQRAAIKTPSVKFVTYRAFSDQDVNKHYQSGMILRFSDFHFEYINSKNNQIPKILKENLIDKGWKLLVCKE
jgi:hypothetical protein